MAIYSMTGFGKGEAKGESFTLSVEVKTVNNRFKDFRFRLPSMLSSKEIELKKKIDEKFKRGSFEVMVNYQSHIEEDPTLDIDKGKVDQFLKTVESWLGGTDVQWQINPVDFLRPQFAPKNDEEGRKLELNELLEKAFSQAIIALEASREDEGKKLFNKLMFHLNDYRKAYQKVISSKDDFKTKLEEKIRQKFSEKFSQFPVDQQRLAQEIVYYLERLDIDEEVSRIHFHLEKLEQTLQTDAEAGRKIDFLVQELNRETNTIGSKSDDTNISSSVVEMKVQLEKIREQGLNIE